MATNSTPLSRATSAVVVGSGPNGLAAAVELAQHGVSVQVYEANDTIGGGCRSRDDLTIPGLVHDICAAVHPYGVASPFLRSLPLEEHGLQWAFPEIDLAHPLDDGTAGLLYHSLAETVVGLGEDGHRWEQLFEPLVERYDSLVADILAPQLKVPHHPLAFTRFGLRALPSASMLASTMSTPQARALFVGNSAHAFQPLTRPMTAAVGALFVATAHARGWPVAVGGSQRIVDALASLLRSLGGEIHTGVRVERLADLPPHDIAMLDTTPSAALRLIGDRVPSRVAKAYRRFRHGPGSFKVDLAVEGGIPWTNEGARRAGTVHVGGAAPDVIAAEAAVVRGEMPERPFVLVGQQYLADPSRSVGDVHPIWAYAHVPARWEGDGTDAILSQIERFAPGTRERIVALHSAGPAELEAHNANYVGGDIAAGANDILQLLGRPRWSTDPYFTGVDGVYLCSASTPPGAGVHGMCGAHAASRALARASQAH